MNQEKREHWKSQIGFILASAGSAIGLGSIWRFPYITGEYGGGAFVIVYLVCIVLIGIPVMLCEFALGRRTQRDPVGAYAALSGNNRFWKLVGFMGVASGFIILAYYSVVGGWTIAYTLKSLTGQIAQFTTPDSAWQEFLSFTAHPLWPLFFHAVFMVLCVAVVYGGVRKGIERVNDVLMPALFVILIAMIIRALTLPGAGAGVEFFLKPDFSKLTAKAWLIAIGHGFFTLSLGMGAMITYGSYVDRKTDLWSATLWIIFLDTAVSMMAGLAIFPVVFAMGADPAGGPGLIFKVLPAVFNKMPGGTYLWSTLFFFLLVIAALASGLSLLEVVTAHLVDKGYDRKKTAVWAGFLIFLLGIPCSLSFGVLSEYKIFGRNFFDTLDYFAANILLPLGGLLVCVFVGWVWGSSHSFHEIASGSEEVHEHKHKWLKCWSFFVRYLTPLAMAVVFIVSAGVMKVE